LKLQREGVRLHFGVYFHHCTLVLECLCIHAVLGSLWPCGQGGGLAVVRSPVRTPPPRAYGGALVVWPGMPFPNLDGRIHQSPVFVLKIESMHADVIYILLSSIQQNIYLKCIEIL
jgi:hypothetical protein